MQQQQDAPRFMTAVEVARLLGVTRETIYNYRKRGVIPCLIFEGVIRFERSEILAWIERRRENQCPG